MAITLIILIGFIVLLVIAGGIGGFLYYLNTKEKD
jgi:hypothetical protein